MGSDSVKEEKKPDDNGNVYVEAKLKIFDPITKEVIVEKRA
jgi:hypothetical protein